MIDIINKHRAVLIEAVKMRLNELYAGSILGRMWAVLFPILFLCIYLFVYLVVFKVRFPGLNTTGFVLYVFSGLLPYMSFMQVLNESTTLVRANLNLIRSVVLPIELISVRVVLTSLVSQLTSILFLLVLAYFYGKFTIEILFLPVAIILNFMMLVGMSWLIAPIGYVLPDMSHVTNLVTLFLLFISPIAYTHEQLNGLMKLVVFLNPIYYLLLPYRICFLPGIDYEIWQLAISVVLCISSFYFGARAFAQAKKIMVDAV